MDQKSERGKERVPVKGLEALLLWGSRAAGGIKDSVSERREKNES